jgi:hypothetical protein
VNIHDDVDQFAYQFTRMVVGVFDERVSKENRHLMRRDGGLRTSSDCAKNTIFSRIMRADTGELDGEIISSRLWPTTREMHFSMP